MGNCTGTLAGAEGNGGVLDQSKDLGLLVHACTNRSENNIDFSAG